MFRSRFWWKLSAAYLVLALAATGLAGVLLGYAAAVATFVALVLAYLLARRLVAPLVSLADVAEAVVAGSYEPSTAFNARDELGPLAHALGEMSQRLRDSLASLQADRSKLTAILSSMVEGVVAVDRDERIVHMNQVAGRLLELDPAAVLGRPIWEVTRIRGISETLFETLRQEQPVERSVRLAGRPDRLLELRSSPLQAGGEVIAGAVLVLDDVTQLRQLETIRQDFVGNVSHELKTPVTAIRGIVETLLDDPDLSPAQKRRFLERIRIQTERLSSLVTDLLSLSRLESQATTLESFPVDLRDPILQAVRTLQPAREAKGVTVETVLPDEAVVVLGDEEALLQAVGNLLDNAIKYSPAGSRVEVRLESDGTTAVIAVADNGIGIEHRQQERIFERFYRVDKARSREVGGTGLGLAIVKHVALALGGHVSVESKLRCGSTFCIHLPAVPEPEVVPEPEAVLTRSAEPPSARSAKPAGSAPPSPARR